MRDGEILIWGKDQTAGAPTRFRLSSGDWNVLAVGANGTEVAAANAEGMLVHFDRQTTRSTTLVSGGAKFVSLSLSPDGKSLATVDERARAMIRSLDSAGTTRAIENVRGEWVDDTGPLVSPTEEILARVAEYSPDGRYLALATDEGILLLDPATLQRLSEPLSRYTGNFVPFAFDGSGLRMARVFRSSVHTSDLSVEMEDLASSSWIRKACAMANRELSDSEIQTYLGGVRPTVTCAQALGLAAVK